MAATITLSGWTYAEKNAGSAGVFFVRFLGSDLNCEAGAPAGTVKPPLPNPSLVFGKGRAQRSAQFNADGSRRITRNRARLIHIGRARQGHADAALALHHRLAEQA